MADSDSLQNLFPGPGQVQARHDADAKQPHHRDVVVVGDPTTHGGSVTTGSPTHSLRGRAIARLGDWVECPLIENHKMHGANQIIEGHPNLLIDGRPVALNGHHSACGCQLIADPFTLNPNAPLRIAPTYQSPTIAPKYGERLKFQPDTHRLAHEPVVRQAIEDAWNQTLKDHLEHGFWILRDPATGALSIDPWKPMDPGFIHATPEPPTAISMFHTHPPFTPEQYVAQLANHQLANPFPSSADVVTSINSGVPAMVRSTAGMYYYGPKPETPLYTDGKTPHADKATYADPSWDYIDKIMGVNARGYKSGGGGSSGNSNDSGVNKEKKDDKNSESNNNNGGDGSGGNSISGGAGNGGNGDGAGGSVSGSAGGSGGDSG